MLGKRGAPGPVLAQAEALASVAAVAERFFKTSTEVWALTAHEANKARNLRKSCAEALKDFKDPSRGDWLSLSRILAETADEASWAVEESDRFKVGGDKYTARMAEKIKESAQECVKAMRVFSDKPLCAGHLAAVKKTALEAEGLYRQARSSSLGDVNVVSGLKNGEVYRRLSQAAEGLQKAADLMAEILVAHA